MPWPEITPTIPVLLRTSAERHGDRAFVVCDGETLSYRDAEARSAALARGLLAAGIGKGDHVGILMPNSLDWVIAWFAATRIGAVAVPVNTFYKARELAWAARHADLRAILAWPGFRAHDFLGRLEEALPSLAGQGAPGALRLPEAPYLRTVVAWSDARRPWTTPAASLVPAAEATGIDAAFLTEVESCVTPADPVVIIYTSGSTGDPKGPVHTHGSLVRHTYNLTHVYVTTKDDVLFTAMPFFWVGGLITGLHAVVHHGATLVTMPAFEAGEALDLIEKHRATITLGWPQQGRTIAAHPSFARRDLSSVRRTSMPEMVPPRQRPPEPHADSLGMTELCGNHLGADPYVPQPESRRGTFGPSVDGLEHLIVSRATGREVPRGEVGEIYARGYSLMQGLYKREREDVFTADGYYPTGDAGRMDIDGWVTFTGRLGDLIKTPNGTNVTPAEVEDALVALDGVLEAYVTGVADGPTHQRVVAAVVPEKDAQLSEDGIRAALRAVLSAYKVPAHIWVTAKSALPFTDTGKVKKGELGAAIAARVGRGE